MTARTCSLLLSLILFVLPLQAGVNRWTPFGPGCESTRSVVPLPGEALHICCEGPCFRSPDGGGTWEGFGPPVGFDPPGIADLAVDPDVPGRIYAAGNGLYLLEDGGALCERLPVPRGRAWALADVAVSRGTLLAAGLGILRSVDGGASWKVVLPKDLPEAGVRVVLRLLQDPEEPAVLYAEAWEYGNGFDRRVLHRSRDGGASWRPILTAGQQLAVALAGPGALYAAGDRLFLRSLDHGTTWSQTGAAPSRKVSGLAVHPAEPETVLAATRNGGVLLSRDGGRTWTGFNRGLARKDITAIGSIVPDPDVPGRFFAVTWFPPHRLFAATLP